MAVPSTMRAWVRDTYGPSSGARIEEVPVPRPGRGEVLLRVRATALNAGDVRVQLGDPLLVRPFFGLRGPRQPIRGMDVAGIVVAVGSGVVGAEMAEEVVGELHGGGGLAAYATVAADRVVPRPPGIQPALAACLPVAGGTAWQALDLAGVGLHGSTSSRVLIIGASSGVGTFAVQLAALRGAEVWASCGSRNAALVEKLGAARTFDHRREALSDLPAGRFDAVLDLVGGVSLRALRHITAPGGVVVLVTGDGGRVLGPIPRMTRAALLSLGGGARIRSLAASARPEILSKLLELVAEGRVVPVIEHEHPFREGGAALARVEAGHVCGKVVVVAE